MGEGSSRKAGIIVGTDSVRNCLAGMLTFFSGQQREDFFDIYTGSDLGSFEDFISTPPAKGHAMLKQLTKALDENVRERKAMELAIQEEEGLVKNLQLAASRIIDPSVRVVFERMASETENHYAIIESKFARMMGMVHETDIDTYVRE